ncbi:hypothetical protein ACHHYP_06204 [Achlya hypogyna]|uniref:Uncharacterized protein n=1 Tax=Achlya hypogyna TaxID=1202772 RepID=A0A1V9YUU3_ACHHY|nr:hypothetical protein ACHHYP_06204 [Achlya hypogyna]
MSSIVLYRSLSSVFVKSSEGSVGQDVACIGVRGPLLRAPVWFNNHPIFQVQYGETSTALARSWSPIRLTWIQHMIDHVFQCLHDFMNADGTWPSEEQFTARMEMIHLSFVRPGSTHRASSTYRRLTPIAEEVWRHHQVPWGQPLLSPTTTAPFWPLPGSTDPAPFYYWSKDVVKLMCMAAPRRQNSIR